MDTRPRASAGWNLWRGVVGVFYLVCAVFNLVYTLPRSDELDGYADGAWFGSFEDFMWDVFMPNGGFFMAAVVVFEVAVGLLILNRGRWVDLGVAASVGWVLLVLPFLASPYLLVNIVLAVVQSLVALRRYDTAVWERSSPDRG